VMRDHATCTVKCARHASNLQAHHARYTMPCSMLQCHAPARLSMLLSTPHAAWCFQCLLTMLCSPGWNTWEQEGIKSRALCRWRDRGLDFTHSQACQASYQECLSQVRSIARHFNNKLTVALQLVFVTCACSGGAKHSSRHACLLLCTCS
jgi:hypothetical protein